MKVHLWFLKLYGSQTNYSKTVPSGISGGSKTNCLVFRKVVEHTFKILLAF